MDFKILCPEFIPETRFVDLPESDHQPVLKPLITPSSSDMFDYVNYPAEGTLYRIGCHGDPALPLKPVVKNQKSILRKVLDTGSGLRVLFRIKSLYQFIKAFFNLFDKLQNKLFIWRQNFLPSTSSKISFLSGGRTSSNSSFVKEKSKISFISV